MQQLLPLAVIATTPREKLYSLVVVLGISTIVLFSIGFLAMALVVNRNMRQDDEQPRPKPKAKTRAPTPNV